VMHMKGVVVVPSMDVVKKSNISSLTGTGCWLIASQKVTYLWRSIQHAFFVDISRLR